MDKMQVRYSLEGKPWASVKSFIIKETDGQDEELAAQYAKERGGAANAMEELVRLSIVEADGKPVTQPYLGFDKLNTKTRAFMFAAWRKLNASEDKEIEDFLKGGEVLEAASTPVGK